MKPTLSDFKNMGAPKHSNVEFANINMSEYVKSFRFEGQNIRIWFVNTEVVWNTILKRINQNPRHNCLSIDGVPFTIIEVFSENLYECDMYTNGDIILVLEPQKRINNEKF